MIHLFKQFQITTVKQNVEVHVHLYLCGHMDFYIYYLSGHLVLLPIFYLSVSLTPVKMPAMKKLYSRTAALRGIYQINVVSSLKHRENNALSNVSSLLQTVSLKHTQSQS